MNSETKLTTYGVVLIVILLIARANHWIVIPDDAITLLTQIFLGSLGAIGVASKLATAIAHGTNSTDAGRAVAVQSLIRRA
jgi:hypothetical protein